MCIFGHFPGGSLILIVHSPPGPLEKPIFARKSQKTDPGTPEKSQSAVIFWCFPHFQPLEALQRASDPPSGGPGPPLTGHIGPRGPVSSPETPINPSEMAFSGPFRGSIFPQNPLDLVRNRPEMARNGRFGGPRTPPGGSQGALLSAIFILTPHKKGPFGTPRKAVFCLQKARFWLRKGKKWPSGGVWGGSGGVRDPPWGGPGGVQILSMRAPTQIAFPRGYPGKPRF